VVHDDEPVGLDGLRVCFDDQRAVSDAGVMFVATLAKRLGIEALAGRLVRLRRDRPGAANAGRKVMALLFAMVLGADSIDDCEVLRAGRTRRLLGGWIPAPSTLGTFLRAFTSGTRASSTSCSGRHWCAPGGAGAGPGESRLVIDVDSFDGEVCGRLKQGAAYGYTKLLGYHPILATRADTREVLHIRLRKGSANTQKGMLRFTDELLARVKRAGASGTKLLRADSGFWNVKVFKRLENAGWQYSIGVRMQKGIREAVQAIDGGAWQSIEYPEEGEAQIAETTYGGRRLMSAAPAWSDRKHNCGPTGGTSRSSPTAPRTSRSSRLSIAITLSSSRSSPISRTRRWRTSPPASSTPTALGPCSARSRTTCSAGHDRSDYPTAPSVPLAPYAADCFRSPAA
jgi:hypothetical protein